MNQSNFRSTLSTRHFDRLTFLTYDQSKMHAKLDFLLKENELTCMCPQTGHKMDNSQARVTTVMATEIHHLMERYRIGQV